MPDHRAVRHCPSSNLPDRVFRNSKKKFKNERKKRAHFFERRKHEGDKWALPGKFQKYEKKSARYQVAIQNVF